MAQHDDQHGRECGTDTDDLSHRHAKERPVVTDAKELKDGPLEPVPGEVQKADVADQQHPATGSETPPEPQHHGYAEQAEQPLVQEHRMEMGAGRRGRAGILGYPVTAVDGDAPGQVRSFTASSPCVSADDRPLYSKDEVALEKDTEPPQAGGPNGLIAPRRPILDRADCYARTMEDSNYWSRYYKVTVDRPAWETVKLALQLFAADDAEHSRKRFAVDLGCGAGRDARELLRAGWRVLAIDREVGAIETLQAATPPQLRLALETRVTDLATVDVPACDLVNASLCLPFLASGSFWRTWERVLAAVSIGGRVAAMLFGDRDGSASDPTMTCPPPQMVRASLASFEIEHWVDREEESQTALGEPHHFHLVELVARRVK